MRTIGRYLGRAGWLILGTLAAPVGLRAQETGGPPVRAIPGITADDPFPRACVSCHVVLPDGRDVRLSTLMTHWTDGVDSLLLVTAQSAAPAGVRLIGR
ncbi:MAG TPA: hypothetical protein VK845_15175, partial [Gemmatimonadales bacterium]|nr:hypothetical protein [Gemmatimonadales bacterium]